MKQYKLSIWIENKGHWIGQHEPLTTNYELNVGDTIQMSWHPYYENIIKELGHCSCQIIGRDYNIKDDMINLYAKVIDNCYEIFRDKCVGK